MSKVDPALSIAIGFLLTFAPALPAQSPGEIRVRLESKDGSIVSGALVALVDSAQRIVTEGVSREDGARLLTAPAGSYRVRVRRIGFLPFLSEPISIPHDGELVLGIESPRVFLQAVVVTSKSDCGPIDPSERTLSTVWDEISKALRTSQLNSRDLEGIAGYFVYHRNVTADGEVVSSDTTFYKSGARKPFGVKNPAVLAVHGYVLGDETTGWTYYGPDEAVLLSDQFAATHCFRVVKDRKRDGQVGIEFEPTRGRSVPDIAGVLWVDQGTAELRELVFRYVNAGALERFRAGGFTKFRRVPSGSWMVDDWLLRAPILRRGPAPFNRLEIDSYVEDGGGLTARANP